MPKFYQQDYPRIQDEESKHHGYLDDTQLVPHSIKLPSEKLKSIIEEAIEIANKKSGREILSILPEMPDDEIDRVCEEAGIDLFNYFRQYTGDPASTAHQLFGKHYREVAKEQFRNRTLQKGRMNSGWRYQYLAVNCARVSGRFRSISDIGAAEADFHAIIDFIDDEQKPLSLYVSVKNRQNTMGGQDWPKAITALESVANNDKNRIGPYCCVFGIAMDRGDRLMKRNRQGHIYSVNTELWRSDFFWPFFANYTYEDIMHHVLEVLLDAHDDEDLTSQVEIPDKVLTTFGEKCEDAGLIDEFGRFDDPYKLVSFFVGK